ncbi:MAG: serine/threonine-protein kinase [Planctomycetes bacterium]|nr:serine/threonine-protein kinase [Planctomycetota bacterium]
MTSIEACPPLEEIEQLVLDRLEAARSSRIRTHLTTCITCSRQVDELRADRELGERLRRSLGGVNDEKLPTIEGYRVLREIGRGGMGVVYEAEQIAPQRRVALKVVRGVQFVDAHTLRLFQREIGILARLEHPGIASLYGAGETKGEQWFAMELVNGKPLTQHAQKLDVSAKLECFIQLCDAIDHAHRQGVVHRDLKPSNVLVTDAGRVQVLDFGLAKITDVDVSHATEAGQIRGTLAYMSPEQARGDPSAIGLQSDVYSLGVILYELLCNALPIDTTGVAIHEAARRVVEEAPRRPSAIVPALRGDLETIVLKALEKDPQRRYAGVVALAEDLRRFLASEVILARPPSSAYELKQLVARHKLPFALAALVVVGALGTAIWTSVLYRRESELLVAQRNLSEERQAALIAEQTERVRAERATEEAQHQTSLAEERLVLMDFAVEARETNLGFMVDLFREVGQTGRSSSTLAAADLLRRAIERLNERKEKNQGARMMMLSYVGTAAMQAGLLDEASKLLEEGVEIARRDQRGLPVLASLLASLGALRREQGRGPEASELLKEANAIYAVKQGAESRNAITARINYAQDLRDTGNPRLAADIMREALARIESSEELRDKRIEMQGILGQALCDMREIEAAQTMLVAAIAEHEPEGPSVGLAKLIHTLGISLSHVGQHESARVQFQAALDMRLLLLAPDDDALAASYNALGAMAMETGDLPTALDLMEKACAQQIKRYGLDSRQVAYYEFNRARVLISNGDFDEAEPLVYHALKVRQLAFGNDSAFVADILVVSAEIAMKRLDTSSAETALREAVRVMDLSNGKPHPNTIQARFRLVKCLMAQKRFDEARELMGEIQVAAKTAKQLNASSVKSIEDLANELEQLAGDESANDTPAAKEGALPEKR